MNTELQQKLSGSFIKKVSLIRSNNDERCTNALAKSIFEISCVTWNYNHEFSKPASVWENSLNDSLHRKKYFRHSYTFNVLCSKKKYHILVRIKWISQLRRFIYLHCLPSLGASEIAHSLAMPYFHIVTPLSLSRPSLSLPLSLSQGYYLTVSLVLHIW